MSIEEFKRFEKTLCVFRCEKDVLVSTDFFNEISDFESMFKFTECKFLPDGKLICFSGCLPISNVAIDISDIYRTAGVVSSIMSHSQFIAFKNSSDHNQIVIMKNSENKEFVTSVVIK